MTVRAVDPNAENNASIVAMLRDYLARAEAGEFRSLHLAAFRLDGILTTQVAGEYSVTDVVAQFEVFKYRLLNEHTRT